MLRLERDARTGSLVNTALWSTALLATVSLAVARAEVFWLLAALVAGLSLSGSV